ncbi:MAG: hypothetical protein M3O32_01950 [Actinomycetota bacterium]|nr:hypothetical protein [Actinomycetota bacterium]
MSVSNTLESLAVGGPVECLPVWDHWDAMVAASLNVLGSRDQAHDCAAEAMAQVLQRRPADIANLEAFMVTVAKRRAIDRHRARARDRRRDARLAGEAAITLPDLAEDIAARAEARWADEQAPVVEAAGVPARPPLG